MLVKALILSAFIVSTAVYACQTGKLSKTVTVKFVYDGDTVYLEDNRKVRLIGIDTPEMRRHNQVDEAFSAEATEALRELLYQHKNQVKLQVGTDAYDRYGRLLSHVFLPDGTNVSKWMLSQGFATTLLIPPNLKYLECYTKAEGTAQRKQLNIWKQKDFQLHVDNLLNKKHTGYTRLVGRVQNVKYNKKSIVIYLRSGIRIKIAQSNLHYFKHVKLNELQGKQVGVTGLLRKKGKSRIIHIKHPVYFNVM